MERAQNTNMTTLTQSLEFSILSAPLGAIDPRALSQAWRTALGDRARETGQTRSRGQSRGQCSCHPERRGEAPESRDRRKLVLGIDPSTLLALRRHARDDKRNALGAAREQAGRAARPRPRGAPPGATRSKTVARTSLRLDGARVQLLVQDARGGLQLVAICKPEMRDRAMRALEEARRALRARGIASSADVKECAPCT